MEHTVMAFVDVEAYIQPGVALILRWQLSPMQMKVHITQISLPLFCMDF